MEPVVGITRMGFRKWYERQLIDGHVALFTCVCCMVAVAICIEKLSHPASLPSRVTLVSVGVAAIVVGWKCWRHYHRTMLLAWRYGECAVCSECKLYGRFVIVASGMITPPATASEPNPEASVWMNVACKKCGHHWRMPD